MVPDLTAPAELHAWLVAQWQEKLDVARAAPVRLSDSALPLEPPPTADQLARLANWVAVTWLFGKKVIVELPQWGRVSVAEGHIEICDHIAAFDPAFAIAVCEAALLREVVALRPRMGEARPHERCVACGADWYGPRFLTLRMIREDDLTGYVTGSGRARVTWVTALADPVDHDDFSTMKAEREQP